MDKVKMKVSYNYLVARSEAATRREAMDLCAVKILREAGPWLEPSLVATAITDSLPNLLPKRTVNSWLPPKYNVRHIRLVEK